MEFSHVQETGVWSVFCLFLSKTRCVSVTVNLNVLNKSFHLNAWPQTTKVKRTWVESQVLRRFLPCSPSWSFLEGRKGRRMIKW